MAELHGTLLDAPSVIVIRWIPSSLTVGQIQSDRATWWAQDDSGSRFPPPAPRISRLRTHSRGFLVSVTETVSNLIFTGPLTWTGTAACGGQNDLFFAPAGERPETRNVREAKARAVCTNCAVLDAVPRLGP